VSVRRAAKLFAAPTGRTGPRACKTGDFPLLWARNYAKSATDHASLGT
jgi:hypothetical protein